MNKIIFDSLMDLTDKLHSLGITVIPKSSLKRQSNREVKE